ncbi:MAG: hypothetical protein GWN32_07030 [Gemmatimonadetes bacterium]|nr:hypothetical protein [Gemmatimonadota bacterium]
MWVGRASEIIHDLGAVAETWEWSEAAGLSRPADALLVQVDARHCRRDVLSGWAERAWQPFCVVSLEPSRGATGCEAFLQGLGYERFLQPTGRDTYWTEIRENLISIIESGARLVPLVTKALATNDVSIVRMLSVAARMIPRQKTVATWADKLGLPGPQRLDDRFVDLRLPSPKRVLDTLRLLQVLEFAHRSSSRHSRDDLGRLFNYSSGDYLGKRARELAGCALGELRGMELNEVAVRCLTGA